MRILQGFSILLILVMIIGCSDQTEPITKIYSNNYILLYEGDNFQIYMLEEMPLSPLSLQITVEDLNSEICYLGTNITNAYVVNYEKEYISLQNGVELELFGTYELIEYGVSFQCHDKD